MEYSAFNSNDDEGHQVTPMPQEALHNNSHESQEKDMSPYGNDPMNEKDYGTDYYLDTQRSCNINRQQSNRCTVDTSTEKQQHTFDDEDDYDLSLVDMDIADVPDNMDQRDVVDVANKKIVEPMMRMFFDALIVFSVILLVCVMSKTSLLAPYVMNDFNFMIAKSMITAIIILIMQRL